MRLRPRSLPSAALGLVAVGIVGNALRLRSRVQSLAVLATPRAGAGVAGATDAGAPTSGAARTPAPALGASPASDPFAVADRAEFGVITAAGVAVDDATVAAAARHADDHGLDVVDLVPDDLPVAQLLELVIQIDPATYRTSPMAPGWGAGHAVVVRRSVLDRLDSGAPDGRQPRRGLDPVAFLRLARRLKHYAPTTTDLAVAPGLHTVVPHASWRQPYLRALLGVTMPVLVAGPAVGAALAVGAPALAPLAGTAVLGAYLAEPALVAGRGPIRPRDLGRPGATTVRRVGGLLARPLRDVLAVARGAFTPARPEVRALADAARRERDDLRRLYAAEMARPDALFEARRATCPWCGSGVVGLLLEMPDMIQCKPGTFRLDRCAACHHTFQNPRLSPAGLDHYYRDFYDGLGAEHTEMLFGFTGESYAGRSRVLRRVVAEAGGDPADVKRWLDVGTGNGHFCLMARAEWPETRFDGLDLSDSIDEAERRGWVETGHRGLFPDLAPGFAGGYDVVSMHHYLEHTREPGLELDAARTALGPGGRLLIELPQPGSAFGRWLSWAWGPWFQPQHQHLIPVANLAAALERRGFTIEAVELAEAHQPVDLVFAAMLVAMRYGPAGSMPWDPPPRRWRQARRGAATAAFVAGAAAGMVGDQLLRPLVAARPELSNTFRLVARSD